MSPRFLAGLAAAARVGDEQARGILRDVLEHGLRAANGSRRRVADELGISDRTLRGWLGPGSPTSVGLDDVAAAYPDKRGRPTRKRGV